MNYDNKYSAVIGVGLLLLILGALAAAVVIFLKSRDSEKKYDPLLSNVQVFTKDEFGEIINKILGRITQIDSEIQNIKSQIKTANLLDGIHGEQLKYTGANINSLTSAVAASASK